MLLTLFLMLALLKGPCLFSSEAGTFLYYSDEANPPTTNFNPPFKSTRKEIKDAFGYLSVRYPSQEKQTGEPFKMMLSVGNGLLGDESIFWQVQKLELRHQNNLLKITPSFYNEKTKKREVGLKALLAYQHESPSHLHRRVEIVCDDCRETQKELILSIKVIIHYLDKSKVITENIPLYQGHYTANV